MTHRMARLTTLAVAMGVMVWAASPDVSGQVATGKAAPAFVAKSLEGKSLDLKRLKGKVVLLQFWGTK